MCQFKGATLFESFLLKTPWVGIVKIDEKFSKEFSVSVAEIISNFLSRTVFRYLTSQMKIECII